MRQFFECVQSEMGTEDDQHVEVPICAQKSTNQGTTKLVGHNKAAKKQGVLDAFVQVNKTQTTGRGAEGAEGAWGCATECDGCAAKGGKENEDVWPSDGGDDIDEGVFVGGCGGDDNGRNFL